MGFVGAEVSISHMPMVITRADEYSLRHMEDNPQAFPVSSHFAILQKISAIAGDPEMQSAASLDPDSFRELVAQKTGVYLVDHELITTLRRFGEPSDQPRIG